MKLQEFTFKNRVKVLQVFCNTHIYGKTEKSFNDRKEDILWNDIRSHSGYIEAKELFLPENILEDPSLKNCDLIIIEDHNQENPTQHSKLINKQTQLLNSTLTSDYCFSTKSPKQYQIFEIRNEAEIELHLRYSYFSVGLPKRDDFKLCEIKKHSAIEIKINGKTDFSMSSRKDRMYKEQEYIFEYKGDFDTFKILKEPYLEKLKKIPIERKVIDLNKPLW